MSERFIIVLAKEYLGKDFPEIAWTTGIAILLISPVAVIGNVLVLASILFDPFKNIRGAPSSNLIFNLALADLLVGVLVGPLMAVWQIHTTINNTQLFSPTIISFTASISMAVSLCSLVALSVDRRIAITTPLQYSYRVTKRKIRYVNISIWIYAVILGILPMAIRSWNVIFWIISGAHTTIVAVVLAVLNIAVVRSVHIQAMNIKRTVDSENQVVLRNAFNRQKAVTRTAFIMVVAFQICFLPFTICSAVVQLLLMRVTDLHVVEIILWVYFFGIVLTIANSLMNPFLYAWRLPKYRKAFQYILNQIKNKVYISAAQPEPNTTQNFVTFQDKRDTPVSYYLSSAAYNGSMISSPKLSEPLRSSAKNITDESSESTKL